MAEERVIKKYANRRLYDAAASRHVTLDDIKTLIVEGAKVKVVDDKTGEDITRSILMQIIAEQEQFGKPILSTEVLESIVRFYGNAMQGYMSRYIDQGVQQFLQQQQSLQSQLARLVSGSPFAQITDFSQANLALWQQMQDSFLGGIKRGGTTDAAGNASARTSEAPAEKRSRKRDD